MASKRSRLTSGSTIMLTPVSRLHLLQPSYLHSATHMSRLIHPSILSMYFLQWVAFSGLSHPIYKVLSPVSESQSFAWVILSTITIEKEVEFVHATIAIWPYLVNNSSFITRMYSYQYLTILLILCNNCNIIDSCFKPGDIKNKFLLVLPVFKTVLRCTCS